MENASKALIIAGAILLAILIIGLGMMVFNNVRERAGDTSAIDELAVTQYNSPYEAYFGQNVSGANLRALIDKVNTHNVSVRNKDDSLLIKINGADASDSLITKKSQISNGKTYAVAAALSAMKNTSTGEIAFSGNGYNTKTGYLTSIWYVEK